jgi:DNA (cytosine-5)-methyltransferase 1
LFGDVTELDGTQFHGVDLVSGGSPCQDLSVAGKRAGLEGARSGLFFEQLRVWNESGAPYLLWENVAGALSSNKGRDFAAVLSAIVGSTVHVPRDGWRGGGGVVAGRTAVAAWRVLDLQHFGPPQRRVRLFVLAARTGGVDPAEVLALNEGVCRHPSPRQQSREIVAASTGGGVAGGVIGIDQECNAQHELMGTLNTGSKTGGGQYARVCALTHEGADASEDGTGRGTPIVARMVAYGEYTEDGMAGAIKARDYKDATDLVYAKQGRPRRLTPKECERLMSWPDQWTQYGVKENGARYALSDTARYRLCGNGVASVQVQWIAERLIAAVAAQEDA